jgi:hypothetical protein
MKAPKPLYRKPTGPKRLLMAEQWDQFARAVLPLNTPAVQRQEMRRAFYAGAQSILFRVIESFAPDSEPTEADLLLMDDLHRELSDFAEAVKEGRA